LYQYVIIPQNWIFVKWDNGGSEKPRGKVTENLVQAHKELESNMEIIKNNNDDIEKIGDV